ncbi:hypothetical protein MRX96_016271 [Rhipicephalus microplus]
MARDPAYSLFQSRAPFLYAYLIRVVFCVHFFESTSVRKWDALFLIHLPSAAVSSRAARGPRARRDERLCSARLIKSLPRQEKRRPRQPARKEIMRRGICTEAGRCHHSRLSFLIVQLLAQRDQPATRLFHLPYPGSERGENRRTWNWTRAYVVFKVIGKRKGVKKKKEMR